MTESRIEEVDRPVKEDHRGTADPSQTKEGLTTAALAEARPPQDGDAEDAVKRDSLPTGAAQSDETAAALLPTEEATDFRSKWDRVQTSFVDEPRKAVEQADSLVAAAMQRLAEMFAKERSDLEGQWDRGDDVSTEDLRQALRRYRSFFTRLLSV